MSKPSSLANKPSLPSAALPVLLLIAVRLMLMMSQPHTALWGYGDSIHFFELAALPGWPYLTHWVEFPPVFPFLSEILFRVANGQQHVFTVLLVMLFSAADVGNLWLFIRLRRHIYADQEGEWRDWVYFSFLAALAYGWWYFDPLAIFCMLLGIRLYIKGKDLAAGAAWGAGLLVKLFPVLALVILWRQPFRKILRTGMVVIGCGMLVYGVLWLMSPQFTAASLSSQFAKGSWETIWALIDGNYRTGNFGPVELRLDASLLAAGQGNPARISPWLTLPIFCALGLAGLMRSKMETPQKMMAGLGWTWALFLLWSNGWSPQWSLYLLPLILLVFERSHGLLMSLVFVLVNLLEWPVILSRGWFYLLPLTILMRTMLLGLMAYQFYMIMRKEKNS